MASERRVLVTGSSRGIGAEIARKLSTDGWKVVIHYTQDSTAAQAISDELGAELFQADLAIPGEAVNLFHSVVAAGPLHALVNNAGVYQQQPFLASDEDFEANLARTFAINFESPLRLLRAAGFYFEQQGSGKILNVASRVGFRGEPGAALYAASKAALINLTRSLAVEWAPKQIGVFGIAPGWVNTAMARDGMEDRLPEILATLPLGRMASPADCAAVASFLLSPEAAYLSGQTIDINGASYFH